MAESEIEDTPEKCQFCNESEVQRLCVHCDLFLCQICSSRIHSKSKACQEHRIIHSKDIGTIYAADVRRRVDIENTTCDEHAGQRVEIFCCDCCELICWKCLVETHNDHILEDLNDHYTEIMMNLTSSKIIMEDNIDKARDIEDVICTNLMNISDEYEDLKNAILRREQEVKTAVTLLSQKLLSELDQKINTSETKLYERLEDVKCDIECTDDEWYSVHQLLLSRNVTDFLISYELTDTAVRSLISSDTGIPIQSFEFVTGDSSDLNIREIFGDVIKVSKLLSERSHQVDLKSVTKIINCNEYQKIICSASSEKLQRIKTDDGFIEVIQEYNIAISDMAMLQNEDVIISLWDNGLQIYTAEGTFKIYKTFYRFQAVGVFVNKHNEILVALKESKPSATSGIGKVVLLNDSGDIQHTYMYENADMDNHILFTIPWRIVAYNDTICVADILNDSWEGRLVALDYEGNIQWTYNGVDSTGEGTFYPTDMVLTSTNNIMVSDCDNHAIHVLNPSGKAIACHRVSNLGLKFPCSLAVDSEGSFWVGCIDENTCDKAEIHVLKEVI